MTRIVRFYLAIFGLQILLIAAATFSFAQVDPTKALIGTWDGWVEGGGDRERTIIITKVTPKEGEVG